ncbi:RNA-binding protein nanos [Lycorma delicatula]|uniref:RNA-binding protein nanos n=1 Tax=Lycorma delicatula TaxID=130591 RepID=UPI003F516D88
MEGSCQQQISVSQPATSSELGAQSSHAFTFKNFTSSQLRSQNMPYDEDNDCQQPTASKSTNPSNQGNFANVTNIVRYPWRSYYYESGNVKYFEQHLGDSASSIHHYQNRSNDVEFCYCEPNSDEIYFRRFQAGYRVGSQNWFHEDDCSSTTSTSTMSQYTSANLQSPIENQRQFSGNQWSGSAELQPNAFAQNFNYMNGSRHGVDKNKRHRMTDRKYKSQEKSICTFCKKNGEPASSYSTHLTKDDEGNITCPILKAYVCQKCGATGRSAHTDKYCHYN